MTRIEKEAKRCTFTSRQKTETMTYGKCTNNKVVTQDESGKLASANKTRMTPIVQAVYT
mgnify:FL=1